MGTPNYREFLSLLRIFTCLMILGWWASLRGADVEVPISTAKTLAHEIAAAKLDDPKLMGVRLYRNLEDSPAVWVLEFHSAADDRAYTVVAAAVRSLPPIVMHWQGLPWHVDPSFLKSAQSAVKESRVTDAEEDWSDLRWEGPFDIWVPRSDRSGGQSYAEVRGRAEISRTEVSTLSAKRSEREAASKERVSRMWVA